VQCEEDCYVMGDCL